MRADRHSIGQIFPQVRACSELALLLTTQAWLTGGMLTSIMIRIDDQLIGRKVQVQIVDAQSANPGYGRFEVVADADHVSVCKPPHRKHIAYRLVSEATSDCHPGRQHRTQTMLMTSPRNHCIRPDAISALRVMGITGNYSAA